MIDRTARNLLSDTISDYAEERIAAFTFDDRIHDIAGNTDDETVQYIVQDLWSYYDDCQDHHVVATKEIWDYFQRVQLMLESNAELRVTRKHRWSIRQLIALGAILTFAWIAVRVGWGEQLFIVAVPFGFISIAISDRWCGPKSGLGKDAKLVPFESYDDLIRTRRMVPWFSKARYPKAISHRAIRSPLMDFILMVQWIVSWLMFAPIVLLYQSFPRCVVSTRLVTPSASATS